MFDSEFGISACAFSTLMFLFCVKWIVLLSSLHTHLIVRIVANLQQF